MLREQWGTGLVYPHKAHSNTIPVYGWMTAWRSGNVVGRIVEVALRRAAVSLVDG